MVAPFPRRRRPSLTPMIDVIFLLLVFFMLAARFGADLALPLGAAGPGPDRAPRVVDVSPDGIALDGVPTPLDAAAAALAGAGTVVVRPRDGADVQRVVTVMERLRMSVGALVLAP